MESNPIKEARRRKLGRIFLAVGIALLIPGIALYLLGVFLSH